MIMFSINIKYKEIWISIDLYERLLGILHRIVIFIKRIDYGHEFFDTSYPNTYAKDFYSVNNVKMRESIRHKLRELDRSIKDISHYTVFYGK